jgi:uncharacterized membrane protein
MRADQLFAACCALVAFILVAFVPRPPPWSLLPALAATVAASAIVVVAYLAVSPPSRPHARRLAMVVAIIDVVGLGAIHVGESLSLGWTASLLLLIALAGAPLLLARRR